MVTIAAVTVYVIVAIAFVTAVVVIATDIKSFATTTVASAAAIIATLFCAAFS